MPQKKISEKNVDKIEQGKKKLPNATWINSSPEVKIERNQPNLQIKEEPVP